MSDQSARRAFGLEDLRVLNLQMQSGIPEDGQDTSLTKWKATYYDADAEADGRKGRIVIGELHAHAPDGFGTVAVGGIFTSYGEVPDDEDAIENVITESVALETLYDFARVTFRTIAGLGDVHFELPYHSPTPKIVKGGDELVVTQNPALSGASDPAELESGVDAHNGE